MRTHATSQRKALLTALICALLVLTVAGPSSAEVQRREPRLTHEQFVKLLASARSARDHERLADYYRSETRRLGAEARRHERFARAFGDNTAPGNPDEFNLSRTAHHCHNVANDSLKEARDALARAARQEQLAQKARSWPR